MEELKVRIKSAPRDYIPALGLGTFGSDRYTPAQVQGAVRGALRHGYKLFDCASVYGNEDVIGAELEAGFKNGVANREEVFITSKVWNDMHGKGDVLLSLAKSLKDLRLDYVDCYFVHWPFPNYHAPGCAGDARNPLSVPFSVERFMATWAQMEKIYKMGLARYIGVSNMTVKKLNLVLPHCKIKPAFLEMECHPAFQQEELYDYCEKVRINIVGFCPLGSPNRPERDKTADDVVDTELEEVVEVASAHGISPQAVCLKWAHQRGIVPIPFSTTEKNYKANLDCLALPPLTTQEMYNLKNADRNCRLVKGQVFLWEGAKGWQDLWD